MKCLAVLVFLVFLSITARADEAAMKELLAAKTIRVTWGTGVQTTWEKGTPETEKTEWSSKPGNSTTVYDNINFKEATATFIGNAGKAATRVMKSPRGISFFDMAPAGSTFVTIFATKDEKTGRFHAVISRHTGWAANDFPGQYYGSAVIVDP